MNRSGFTENSDQRSNTLSRRVFCGAGLATTAGLLLHSPAAEPPPAPGLNRRWTVFVIQHSHIDIGYTEKHGGFPFGRPLVPFHGESPSGKRILAWCGMAYHMKMDTDYRN